MVNQPARISLPSRFFRWLRARWPWVIGGGLVLFGAIQLVPYRLAPAPQPEPRPFQWKSPQAEAIAKAACYDCHSAQTKQWWAVRVAPFSWLARSDVDEARRRVDFSNWNGRLTPARLRRSLGEMPPLQYTLFHPEARLSAEQKDILVQGFQDSLPANGTAAPAAARRGSGALVRVAAPDPQAEAVINLRCAVCHSSGRALDFRTSDPARAETLVNRMVRRGAKVSPEERKVLVAYFTR